MLEPDQLDFYPIKQRKQNQKQQISNSYQRPRDEITQLRYYKQIYDINQQFQLCLGKLSTLDTKDIALKEIQLIINNNSDPEALRLFISVLQEHKRPINFISNEQEVLIIGYIASIFQQNLLDPLDKPATLIKSVYRILEMIIKYFKDSNENVQLACAKSWKEIYKNCLVNESAENKLLLLYETLSGILSGGTDMIMQQTAAIVLDGLLDLFQKVEEREMMQNICNRFFVKIFFKTQLDHPSVIRCAKFIVQVIHVQNMMQYIGPILDKCIYYLTKKKQPETSYKSKIVVCELLEVIGSQYIEIHDIVIGSFHTRVLPVLVEATRDRTIKVQNSAKLALKQWIQFKESYEKIEQQKLVKQQFDDSLDIDQYLQKNVQNYQRNAGQIYQVEPTRGLKIIQKEADIRNVLQDEGGWVKETRAKNFLLKKQGVGGGQTQVNMQNPKRSSHQHNQLSIKERILGFSTQPEFYQPKKENIEFVGYNPNPNPQPYPSLNTNNLNYQNNNQEIYEPQQNIKILPNLKIQETLINKTLTDTDFYNPLPQKQIQDNRHMNYNPPPQQVPQTTHTGKQIQNNQHIKFLEQQLLMQCQNQNQQQVQQQVNQLEERKDFEDSLEETLDLNTYQQKPKQEFQNQVRQPQEQIQALQQDFQKQIRQPQPQPQPHQQIQAPQQDFYNVVRQPQPHQQIQAPQQNLWEVILQYVDQDELDQAYKTVLDSKDDIYLIRLMMITGKCMKKLSRQTGQKLIVRYIQILKSNFVKKICLDFYEDSYQQGITDRLPQQDRNDITKNLYQLSGENNAIGEQAAVLFQKCNQIQ